MPSFQGHSAPEDLPGVGYLLGPFGWFDTLCINQKDPDERSSQVDLMRGIYSKAELVLSWLGHGIDEIDIAFHALKTIAKEKRQSGTEDAGVEWLKSYPTWWDDSAGIWVSIQTTLHLPYWRRVWIFQELVLGKQILVIHGYTALKYEDLARAGDWLLYTGTLIRGGKIEKPSFLSQDIWPLLTFNFPIAAILRIEIAKRQKFVVNRDPWKIFYLSCSLRATDPRDHVYGLLGLQDFNIVPDYRKDLGSVFHDLVDAWIKESKRLDCLICAGVGTFHRGPSHSLASWAPNFSFSSQQVGPALQRFQIGDADQGIFPVSTSIPKLIDFVLHVSALFGPVVAKVHEVFTSFEQPFEFALDFVQRTTCAVDGIHPLKLIFESFRGMMNDAADSRTSFVRGERPVRLAICVLRILLAPAETIKITLQERSALLGVPLDDSFPESFFGMFFPGLSFERNGFLERLWYQHDLHEEMTTTLWRITQVTQVYFRFAEMDGGYLGLAPRFSRPGDVVAILHGCRVPVILRKHEDHYILIGTSNIPRFMEGEGKELYEAGAARFEDIQIR